MNKQNAATSTDYCVMKTADDASRAKHAAVEAGYYSDPYAAAFAPPPRPRPVQVIIKRGTFARVACIEAAVRAFIETATATGTPSSSSDEVILAPQVVFLGAGKDTTFFRMLSTGGLGKTKMRWYEIDHDEMLREKISAIKQHASTFRSSASRKQPGVYELSSKESTPWPATCHLVSHDLRDDLNILFDEKLSPLGFDRSAPTLCVMECVQMYLPVETVDSILHSLFSSLQDCHFCTYEPVLQDDSFGKVMERNLTKARLIVPEACLAQRRSIAAMLTAIQEAGAKKAIGSDMLDAYATVLSPTQRQTASRCEFLDELEEWTLIMKHYCFLVASNNDTSAVGRQFCSIGEKAVIGFQRGKCESLEDR